MEKLVLITGGTEGIGKEAAIGLAKLKHNVIIIGRSEDKGNLVVNKMKKINPEGMYRFYAVDLSSFRSIRLFADKFKKLFDKLDVLINNAGVFMTKHKLSEDGYELTFAVNHLGHFLLTHLLLDQVKASEQGRIINVSSAAHSSKGFNFDDYNREQKFSGFEVYGESKLCNIYFTNSLAKRLSETKVTVNSVHPGFVATKFGKNNGMMYRIGMTLLRPMMISQKKGSETTIFLSVDESVRNITGKYFVKKVDKRASRISYDEEMADRLWNLSEKLIFGEKL